MVMLRVKRPCLHIHDVTVTYNIDDGCGVLSFVVPAWTPVSQPNTTGSAHKKYVSSGKNSSNM